ncbi:MAG: glycosyltransferase [bacterium]
MPLQVTLTIFVLLPLLIYLSQTVLIYLGTHRLGYARSNKLPSISILVALRNEERTLASCVNSLLNLEYPPHLLEIVLINDRSRDRTPALIEQYKQKSNLIKTVHIDHSIKGLSGKANAIAQAINLCRGEIILVTDGDCQVPKTWAKAHAACYRKNVGLVGGFTLLDKKHTPATIFSKIQSLDWAYLLSIGTGAMGFGWPLSVLGNNFSFRRAAYEEVGGYRKMGFTIIEDFALMKTLLHKTNWKVLYPIEPEMLVYSQAMPDFKAFYQQRKRWSAGGKEVGLYGKFLMALALTVHTLVPISWFLINPVFCIAGLAVLIAADYCLLLRTTGLVHRRDLLRFFAVWEIFYFLYTILFTPVLLFPTSVKWKDTTYTWKLNWKLKEMTERI